MKSLRLQIVALIVPIASSFQPAIPARRYLSNSVSATRTEKLSAETSAASSDVEPPKDDNIIDRSTFSLLEHVNLNVPNHDYVLEFYLYVLGCGLDPRVAVNLMDNEEVAIEEGLVWPNCGANQFHLPLAETAQVLPGHIGLRYRSLNGLKERLAAASVKSKSNRCFESYEVVGGPGAETVKIRDRYGNVFHCREGPEKLTRYKQPILGASETDRFGGVAVRYGKEESDCRGIDYVEFDCRPGTAEKIATFYDSVFDATASVVEDKGQKVALVAFGDIDASGRASQYLIFRETPPSGTNREYDGHHIALYVGRDKNDFEQAFRNADTAEIVWVNPRFEDKVTTLDAARSLNQFRFKNVVDMNTGEPIFELEHEIRSVEHRSWPGVAG